MVTKQPLRKRAAGADALRRMAPHHRRAGSPIFHLRRRPSCCFQTPFPKAFVPAHTLYNTRRTPDASGTLHRTISKRSLQMHYPIAVAGLKRDLPLFPISDELQIAAFIMLGDQELTVAWRLGPP